jgi:hypothetical protein
VLAKRTFSRKMFAAKGRTTGPRQHADDVDGCR